MFPFSPFEGRVRPTSSRFSFKASPVPSQSILGCLFLRPEFCVEAVVLTVSTRELRTDRRRAVAVGGGQPPTRQRRHSPAGLLGRWLAVESVVRVADLRGTARRTARAVHAARRIILTNSLYGHHQATPASAGVATYRSEGTARRSVRGDSPPRTAAVPLISCCRCRYRLLKQAIA